MISEEDLEVELEAEYVRGYYDAQEWIPVQDRITLGCTFFAGGILGWLITLVIGRWL